MIFSVRHPVVSFSIGRIICVTLFAVGACGKDISIQFENDFGRSTRLQTEKALEEALKVLYRWQDQVEFNRQEVKRDVARFGVEFMENLNQIERWVITEEISMKIYDTTTFHVLLLNSL